MLVTKMNNCISLFVVELAGETQGTLSTEVLLIYLPLDQTRRMGKEEELGISGFNATFSPALKKKKKGTLICFLFIL